MFYSLQQKWVKYHSISFAGIKLTLQRTYFRNEWISRHEILILVNTALFSRSCNTDHSYVLLQQPNMHISCSELAFYHVKALRNGNTLRQPQSRAKTELLFVNLREKFYTSCGLRDSFLPRWPSGRPWLSSIQMSPCVIKKRRLAKVVSLLGKALIFSGFSVKDEEYWKSKCPYLQEMPPPLSVFVKCIRTLNSKCNATQNLSLYNGFNSLYLMPAMPTKTQWWVMLSFLNSGNVACWQIGAIYIRSFKSASECGGFLDV
jgi:hypothetical protein